MSSAVAAFGRSYPAGLDTGVGLRAELFGLRAKISLDYANVQAFTGSGGYVMVQDAMSGLFGRLALSSLPANVQNGSVTNAKAAAMPAQTVKANLSNAPAQPQDVAVSALVSGLGLAPLNSPGFTGAPTAPTPAAGANTTQIATAAFVTQTVAGLVGSAPATLDTLNELAAALGNDANFATTIANALATKVTGDAQGRVPPSKSTSSTRNLATNGDGASGVPNIGYILPTASGLSFETGLDTLAPSFGFRRFYVKVAAGTLPANTSVTQDFKFRNLDTGVVSNYNCGTQRYIEASASMLGDFDSNILTLVWVDASDNIVGFKDSATVGSYLVSGEDPDKANRAFVCDLRPANATRYFLRISQKNSSALGAGKSAGFTAVMIGNGVAGQTEPSKYIEPKSPVTPAVLDTKTSRGGIKVADTAYAALASDAYIGISALTASRIITLPAASSFPVGQPLYVADETGLLSNTLKMTLQGFGSDTIAGQPSVDMMSPYQKLVLHSNGSNLWTY